MNTMRLSMPLLAAALFCQLVDTVTGRMDVIPLKEHTKHLLLLQATAEAAGKHFSLKKEKDWTEVGM